jgi:hypothetical protein
MQVTNGGASEWLQKDGRHGGEGGDQWLMYIGFFFFSSQIIIPMLYYNNQTHYSKPHFDSNASQFSINQKTNSHKKILKDIFSFICTEIWRCLYQKISCMHTSPSY